MTEEDGVIDICHKIEDEQGETLALLNTKWEQT
jgi:hypothetical protein